MWEDIITIKQSNDFVALITTKRIRILSIDIQKIIGEYITDQIITHAAVEGQNIIVSINGGTLLRFLIQI